MYHAFLIPPDSFMSRSLHNIIQFAGRHGCLSIYIHFDYETPKISSDPKISCLKNTQNPGSWTRGFAQFSTEANPATKQEQTTSLRKTGSPEGQVSDAKIFATLSKYLWKKDNLEFRRLRVIAAVGLLIGAKVVNIQVPILFKLAVDWLATASGKAGALAEFTTANSTFLALFASPAAVLIGYGIARTGASAFNGILM